MPPKRKKKRDDLVTSSSMDSSVESSSPLPEVAEAAINQCNRIQETIEDIDRTSDFLTSVYEQVGDMSRSIQKWGRITDKQQMALDNWEASVNKWKR